jgi:hypothetical protein
MRRLPIILLAITITALAALFSDEPAAGATQHDIEINSISGNTQTQENQSKGYSVQVANNGPVDEVIPIAVAVLPLTGCAAAGIDVTDVLGTGPPDGLVTAADGNINVDINSDTILDTVAFTASGVIMPGAQEGVDFEIQYGDCPGSPPTPIGLATDTTILDFVILADACHQGDPAFLAPLFGGAPCGGVGAPTDAGIDEFFANDGPVTRIVNVTTYLLVL